MQYPFDDSKTPSFRRPLLANFLSLDSNLRDELFPHLVSSNVALVAGCSKEFWDDLYECMLIYCWEHGIKTMFFCWDDINVSYQVVDWKTLIPSVRDDFRFHLESTYQIGPSIPFVDGPRQSLIAAGVQNCTIQMFVSPPTGTKSSAVSTTIPSLTARNPSAHDIINERNLKCFCHSSLGMNIGNPGCSDYIGKVLSYCSAHGFIGVVFHCGKTTRYSLEETLQNMKTNIVEGIRKFPNLSAKFLLETSAGQKNETLSAASDFLNFATEILSIPDVAPHFGVCVDTCHVFSSNYDPYNLLKEFYHRVPVDLLHFNDSKNGWNSRVDRHENPGSGYIPWPLLEKAAFFAYTNNIPIVYEC